MRGPLIERPKDGVATTYEAAFALQWPVFPVKLSKDPAEIRAATNAMFRHARDPEGIGERDLLPWTDDTAPAGPNPNWSMDSPFPYIIPTSTEPLRVYNAFEARPRVLDRVLALDLDDKVAWPESILGFVKAHGLLGSTWWVEHPGGRYGDRTVDVRTQLKEVQRLANTWKAVRDVPFKELPFRSDRSPFVDRQAISEMIVSLNLVLMKGVGPNLRFDALEDGAIRFTTGFTCRTLIDVIHMQLYTDITGSREYAHCKGCGMLFGQDRRNQRYCSTDCGNAARQRKHRAKKKR
jgi:hypothetical protein